MKKLKPEGTVYWITGLSGSGKSTLAEALHAKLIRLGEAAVIIDGDTIRELLLSDLRMDRESRLNIARFNARLCRFLSVQGLDVVCATISLFHSVQAWNRANITNYVEILLNTPLEHLEKRDTRGLYARARLGEITNVVGIDIEAEWPYTPDFEFSTEGMISAAAIAELIRPETEKEAYS